MTDQDQQFARAVVDQLYAEHQRLADKEFGLVQVQLLFAAKHCIEKLLHQVAVLETERAMREESKP